MNCNRKGAQLVSDDSCLQKHDDTIYLREVMIQIPGFSLSHSFQKVTGALGQFKTIWIRVKKDIKHTSALANSGGSLEAPS